MILPPYVFLIVLCTLVFMAITLTIMVANAVQAAPLAAQEKRRFLTRFALYLTGWFALGLAVSYTNALVPQADVRIPYLPIAILGPTLLGSALLYQSKTATAILRSIPIHSLAAVQVYRIIGLIFLLLYSDGILSAYFALSTAWGDITIGITAPVVGYLLYKNPQKFRWVGLVWCVTGILDLLLVLFKALNSAPGPQQTTAFELPTVIIGYFPFSIIPLFVVPLSLILHGLLIRRLMDKG
jgi:hypothetical protein